MSAQAYRLNPFEEPLSVPKALASKKNWIGWRAVPEYDEHGVLKPKPKKLPICIQTGQPDGYTLPENHVTYSEAIAAIGRLKLSGVGFVMTPGCGMIGGDMDKCRDPDTGVIDAWAQAIIDRKETYFEISPSGRGIRFFALSEVPLRETINDGGVELYSSGRYLTFTGQRIVGTPLEVHRARYAVETLMQRAADAKAARRASKGQPAGQSAAPSTFEEIANRKAYRESPMGKINVAALENMDAWVPELFPTAEKTAAGGYRVKQADLGRPELEEDLSLSPSGIKDWGVHDMGDAREGRRMPIDVVMEWSKPPIKEAVDAAEWLGVRVGVPFDAQNTGSSGGSADNDVPPLKPTSPTTFVGRQPAPREWIVPDWVPCRVVTGLYGDGGTGKSLLAQQLQTATALGGSWVGLGTTQCVSLGLYCEDDEDELWRRQDAINAACFTTSDKLGAMHWLSRPTDDNALMVFTRQGIGETTKLHARLVEAVLDLGARLTVIDTAADTFMGAENDRGQARQFVQRALGSIASKTGGAVVCCAHPSLSGLISGSGTSGSTGWNNAFRSRHYLELPKGEPDDTLLRTLTRKKANYAARGVVLGLRWASGALVPDGTVATGLASGVTRRPCEDVFCDILREFGRQGRPVSPSRTAHNSPGKLFGDLPKADREGYSGADFMRTMEVLLKSGLIVSTIYKNKGYESFKLGFPAVPI